MKDWHRFMREARAGNFQATRHEEDEAGNMSGRHCWPATHTSQHVGRHSSGDIEPHVQTLVESTTTQSHITDFGPGVTF